MDTLQRLHYWVSDMWFLHRTRVLVATGTVLVLVLAGAAFVILVNSSGTTSAPQPIQPIQRTTLLPSIHPSLPADTCEPVAKTIAPQKGLAFSLTALTKARSSCYGAPSLQKAVLDALSPSSAHSPTQPHRPTATSAQKCASDLKTLQATLPSLRSMSFLTLAQARSLDAQNTSLASDCPVSQASPYLMAEVNQLTRSVLPSVSTNTSIKPATGSFLPSASPSR